MRRAWIALGLTLLAGCGSSDPEELVGITRGVYGRTQRVDPATGEVEDIGIDVYTMSEAHPDEMRATTSGPHGFYELGLEPGDHWICVDSGTCSVRLHITDGLRRCDFVAVRAGGGTWRCAPDP